MYGLGVSRLPDVCSCCGVAYKDFRSGWDYGNAYEHVAYQGEWSPSKRRVLREMWALKQAEWERHLAACAAGLDPNVASPSSSLGARWDSYTVTRCRRADGTYAPNEVCETEEGDASFNPEDFMDPDF